MSIVAEKFVTSLSEFRKNTKELEEEQTNIDKKVSTLYHILEYVPLNAAKTAMVTKELRSTLKERRKIKFAMSLMSSVRDKGLGNLDKLETTNRKKDNTYYKESLASYRKLFGGKQ